MTGIAKFSSDLTTEIDRIKALDTPALRAELAKSLGLTAAHLLHLAAVWHELESRGEDLSDLRSGIATYLPAIAAGTVLPETVVRFAGRPALLRAVASLVPDEQRRLVDGEAIPLVVRQGDQFTHRRLPVHTLTAVQIRQVFGDRSIRSETEQTAILASPPPKWRPGTSAKRGKVVVDRGAGTVRIGRSMASADEVIAALRACGMIA